MAGGATAPPGQGWYREELPQKPRGQGGSPEALPEITGQWLGELPHATGQWWYQEEATSEPGRWPGGAAPLSLGVPGRSCPCPGQGRPGEAHTRGGGGRLGQATLRLRLRGCLGPRLEARAAARATPARGPGWRPGYPVRGAGAARVLPMPGVGGSGREELPPPPRSGGGSREATLCPRLGAVAGRSTPCQESGGARRATLAGVPGATLGRAVTPMPG